MTKPFKHWKVLSHGKLKQIDDNILTVTGDIHMPLMDLPRRMTVVRLSDSRLRRSSHPCRHVMRSELQRKGGSPFALRRAGAIGLAWA